MHLFSYELKNPNRQTTKSQWKKVQRWLRIYRSRVEKEVELDIKHVLLDLMLYGSVKCQ